MALRWQWNEKLGEALVEKYGKEYTVSIYQGNALLIFLHEFKNKENVDCWEMFTFFADKTHFDNCRKDKEWNYAECFKKITFWNVPADVWHVIKDLYKRGVEIQIKKKESKQ